MTKQRDFKKKIRERMKKTGERYSVARYHLLQNLSPATSPQFSQVFQGYSQFGGRQADTGVLKNVFAYSGIENPITQEAFTESMILGLCGGLGFMYAVFEYEGWPPMLTITLRSRTMSNLFIERVFKRAGVEAEFHETGSEGKAQKALDQALEEQQAPICVVDLACLSYYGFPSFMAGASPHNVAVVGFDDTHYWLDDRAVSPSKIERGAFVKARARYRKGKNRLITVKPGSVDLQQSLREALEETVLAMRDGDVGVPKSFRVNCGLSGLRKFSKLLTDIRDKKSWAKVFSEGSRAYAGLWRVYECVQHEYTSLAAGRLCYADFLDQAAAFTGLALKPAADHVRESAKHWQALVDIIEGCDDESVQRAIEISHQRARLLDQQGSGSEAEMKALWDERKTLGEASQLSQETMRALCARLAAEVDQIAESEAQAVALMAKCLE